MEERRRKGGKERATKEPFRFAPPQNALPEPVRIPTSSSWLASNHSQTAWSSSWPLFGMQFRLSGRERVTSSTRGEGYVSVKKVAGGGAGAGAGGEDIDIDRNGSYTSATVRDDEI